MGTRGGRRPGAGRKPKSPFLRSIDGNAGRRPVPETVEALATAPAEEFEPPATLTPEGRQQWMELAPHAFKARTLTRGTSLAFCVLCENVVILHAYQQSVNDRGTGNHRGMIQRVENGLDAFDLRPRGKAIYQAEPAAAKPADPLARFLKHG